MFSFVSSIGSASSFGAIREKRFGEIKMLLSVFFGGGDVALGDLRCLLFGWTVTQMSELELVGEGLLEESFFFFF